MLSTRQRLALGLQRRAAPDPGGFRWNVSGASGSSLLERLRGWLTSTGRPTVFHVTHPKAGSQWINRIFHSLAHDRLVMPEKTAEQKNVQFLSRPIQAGKVYPTVYVTREEFDSVTLPKNSRWFFVIRDLRDTLVSAYFSIKHSHAMTIESDLQMRSRLLELDQEKGLLYLLDDWLPERAEIQRSWIGAPTDLLKYEEMLANDEEILTRVLIDHCQLGVSQKKLREVILANRFEARSGRKPGVEDVNSHERKGVAGDWRNQFSDKVAKTFKNRFGDLLVDTGYEANNRW